MVKARSRSASCALYLVKMLAVLAACIVLGTVLLCCVYAIPITDKMRQNVTVSADILLDGYYELHWSSLAVQDAVAEGIMIGTAIYQGTQGCLTDAMESARSLNEESNDITSLIQTEEPTGTFHKQSYERYWHGYLVFLKPVLLIMDLRDIRGTIMITEFLVIMAALCLLMRKGKAYLALPYMISILMLYPTGLFQSMQYAPPFFVYHAGMFLLLLCGDWLERKHLVPILFLLLGILIAYFDFLTWPIATLGIPLALWYILYGPGKVWSGIWSVIRFSLCWGLGYAGMWVGKWVVSSAVLGKSISEIAFSNITERAGLVVLGEPITRFSAITNNLRIFANWPYCLLFFGLAVALFIVFMRNRRTIRFSKRLVAVLPLLLIGLMPFAWYFVLANHSHYHAWFTARALSVWVFSWLSAACCLLRKGSAGLSGFDADDLPQPSE